MGAYRTIKLSQDARGVATVTLSRPGKHNAFNDEVIAELRDVIARLAAAPDVRVAILAAEGKSFCAGGDLGWMQEQAGKDRAGKIAQSSELAQMLRDLDSLPKPVIARVQGAAYGGGIGLMAVCDIAIAAEDAKFALTETRLGLIPATIAPYVLHRIGEGAARRIFFNGKSFNAAEALALGLVSAVVSQDELDDAVEAEAAAFLECAPGAVAEAKGLCLHLARNPSRGELTLTAERLADRWETKEAQEGIRAFLERRRPPWSQRKG